MQQGSVSGHLRGCEGLKCAADGTHVDVSVGVFNPSH